MKIVLAWIASHLAAVVVAGAVVYLAVDRAHEQKLRRELQAQQEKALDEKAKELGATKAEVQSERQIVAGLQGQLAGLVAAMKKQNRGAMVASASTGTATIAESSKGTFTPATETAPAYCTDAWGIVRVGTQDCSFDLNLQVKVSAVAIRGVDGKTMFTKQRVDLLSPLTGDVIPGAGADVKIASFLITEEAGPERVWRLKILGGVDERFSPGAGLQFLEKARLSGRVLGFYRVKDHDLRGLVGVGWRPRVPLLDSQVAVGAGLGLSTKATGLVWGAHLTVPLGEIR